MSPPRFQAIRSQLAQAPCRRHASAAIWSPLAYHPLSGRARGPVFLADRRPTRPVAWLDLCPVTGRARLSYRRAAELFKQSTRRLAHPDAAQDELTRLGGWTLHQLRHSQLTHEAESGTNTPTLLARSRHASVRSLERYARPGSEAVARHVAANDPAARRRHR